ncbi:MAG: hypothetical protein LIO46_06335 [Clostridiales bacterium]|nr:hypothetical protein [Clostridiales bacterium]
MSNEKGNIVFRNLIADYLDVSGNGAAANYVFMNTFENVDENPNAQLLEKHYTSDRASSTVTTGYQTQFAITSDMYQGNKADEYLRDIAEEQQIGVETNYIRVRLYEPVEDEENTYYARKFRVSPEITAIAGNGGEVVNIQGNLHAVGDVEIGTFNTETRTFTPVN